MTMATIALILLLAVLLPAARTADSHTAVEAPSNAINDSLEDDSDELRSPSYYGLDLHRDRPYYRQLLRLLRTPLPSPPDDTWLDVCQRIRNDLLADAGPDYVRDVYEPRARWYIRQYPMAAFERLFDLLQFFFGQYAGRDDPDPDAWPQPDQHELITARVLAAYMAARGLPTSADDDDDDDANWESGDATMAEDGSSDRFHSAIDYPDWIFNVDIDDDDDDDEFKSVTSETPRFDDIDLRAERAPTAGLFRTFTARPEKEREPVAITPLRRWRTLPCRCPRKRKAPVGNQRPSMVDIMVADLSRFPPESTLGHRWWTDLGLASAILGLVVLVVVTLLLCDTHVFRVTLPDQESEPREFQYVLRNGARISVRAKALGAWQIVW